MSSEQRPGDAVNLLLLGAGGHARSCLDVIRDCRDIEVVGILDPFVNPGTTIDGVPVLGSDTLLHEHHSDSTMFLCSIGVADAGDTHMRVFLVAEQTGVPAATIISPSASVSDTAAIGRGTIVMKLSVVNAGAAVGRNVIVNSCAIVEHDAKIGDHTHISTGAIVNGGCRVGTNCLIGSGAVVLQNTVIGDRVVVGAGAVVTRDLSADGTYVGVPARRISSRCNR